MWKRIPKEDAKQPKSGNYRTWKPILAEEAEYKCVYCAIFENNFGGIRNYHVEHFRPKSIEDFKKLENDITNLFYSCSICNCFKGNDWRIEPDEKKSNKEVFYYDPAITNYSDVFTIKSDNLLEGNCLPSNYMITKLYLNRPQLIVYRREKKVTKVFNQKLSDLLNLANKLVDIETDKKEEKSRLLKKSLKILGEASEKYKNLMESRPYSSEDIRR